MNFNNLSDIGGDIPLTPSSEPRQKLADSLKTENWGIQNILWLEQKLIHKNSYSNTSKLEMKRNSNLYYHTILDPLEIARICNPYNIKDFKVPPDFKHYKIEQPKIQTLKGEELKRRFEWKVYVVNRDAISQKEEQKKQQYFQWMTEKIKSESFDEQSAEQELQKLQDYLTYDWQELRERTSDELLHYYNQSLDLKTVFSRAWESGIIKGQEIIDVDEHNGKPLVETCNPQTLYWVGTIENPYIDDCDEVCRVHYLPLGKVIDYYYDYLTPSQIDDLEELTSKRDQFFNEQYSYDQAYIKDDKDGTFKPSNSSSVYLNGYQTLNSSSFGSDLEMWYDEDGNIRIVNARWKSFRKVGWLKYYDEQGDQQIKQVDENYKIDISKGEEVEWKWITEAWEGTRIGRNIFIKIKPRSCQFRDLDSPSQCSLGYVGLNIDNSIFSLMKQYSIMYDAYMWRTNEALKKFLGTLGVMELSEIPDEWTIDMWLHYATQLGWVVKDKFKESKKGASQGKVAGSMSGDANTMVVDQYKNVDANMKMLQYIEQQLDLLIGINPQRQGQITADAGLQVTRDAMAASSNVTESYFQLHDNVKLRTLRNLLEVAKYCLKNKNETIQYITSEMTSHIFEVDGELLNEASYGILVGDATNDKKTIDILQEAVKIALQTGAVDLIQLMDIFSNDNTSSIKRKIEKSVRAKQEQDQKNIEAEQKEKQDARQQELEIQQSNLEDKDLDRELERYKIDEDNRTKIETAEISAYGFEKAPTEVIDNSAELALKQQELAQKKYDSDSKLLHEQQKHDKELLHKKQELELKKQELKQKQESDKTKKEIENKKLMAQREENSQQNKLSKDKHKADLEIANKKLAIEKIKARKVIKK